MLLNEVARAGEEAALSENVAERESASCALASMDLAEGRLDAAQARLDALPESRGTQPCCACGF